METRFVGLKVGLMVKNIKTSKNWMITEFVTSYSSVKKQSPDEFKVRLSNGTGRHQVISVEDLRKNFNW